jgi:hypothetical protein
MKYRVTFFEPDYGADDGELEDHLNEQKKLHPSWILISVIKEFGLTMGESYECVWQEG